MNGNRNYGTYTQWNITQLFKKKGTFKSVLMTWMNLELITQSEVWYFITASYNQGRLLMTLDLHYSKS